MRSGSMRQAGTIGPDVLIHFWVSTYCTVHQYSRCRWGHLPTSHLSGYPVTQVLEELAIMNIGRDEII